MFLYFWKRLLHKKNFYLALLAGAMLSMLYIAKDVYPYRGWEVLTGRYMLRFFIY